MAPRTLASLAHSLAVAPDLGGAIGVLGEALAELDRGAYLAYFRYDGRRELLTDRLSPSSVGGSRPTKLEVAFDQLPISVRQGIAAGSTFVDVTERAADFARLLGLPPVENATLSIRGLRFDGTLGGVLTVVEPKKFFGGRTIEKFLPNAALFDLAFARFAEMEARREAVITLESVTQRIHGEYDRRLVELETRLSSQTQAASDGAESARIVQLERETSRIQEDARRFHRQIGRAHV